MQSLFSVKTLQKFVAYFVAGLSIMLLISSQANSHISIKSSGYPDNPEVVIDESIAQANPGDGVINEIFGVLYSYGVSLDYFYIEGYCHGQYFRRTYSPRSSNDFELEFASSSLKESNIGSVAGIKQFNNEVEYAVQDVLRRNDFGGTVSVKGNYRNGQPCTFKLNRRAGCAYC